MVVLYHYFKLVEKDASLVSVVWKGAHMAVFLATFLCSILCSFGFHELSSRFQDNCVLFPRSMQLSSIASDDLIVYGHIPIDLERNDEQTVSSVAFISTQWSEASICYVPEYVPLLSAIFALIWTAMFLICSTGGRSLSGLLRPWRVLAPGFVFAISMAAVSTYTSYVTHSGIADLCSKLDEITDKYHGDVPGVHWRARLTVAAAWLHTACWLAAAALMLARVVLAVDFQLVRVQVVFHGDLGRLLKKYEDQLRLGSADGIPPTEPHVDLPSKELPKLTPKDRVQFRNKATMFKSDMHLHRRMNEQRIQQRGIHFGAVKFLSLVNLRSGSEFFPEVSGSATYLGMRSFDITSKDMLHDIYRAVSTKHVSSVDSSKSSAGAARKTHLNEQSLTTFAEDSSHFADDSSHFDDAEEGML